MRTWIHAAGVAISLGLAACSGGSSNSAACTATLESDCKTTDSQTGYGKCVWTNNACAAPTAATVCSSYTTAPACGRSCSWTNNACTGTSVSGQPCNTLTTEAACEATCGWNGTACVSDPCDGKASESACVTVDALNGYGKCVWSAGKCGAPSATSSCGSYKDQASCDLQCTWSNNACSGPTPASGLGCANYTSQAACEANCRWTGTVCDVDPCDGKSVQADCLATDSLTGFGKCLWDANRCGVPTPATACNSYTDQSSCESTCSWSNNACTGPSVSSGLTCSSYTTASACAAECAWNGTACLVK